MTGTSQTRGGSRRIAFEDHRVVPWKNGGGMTREIATGGANAEGDDWGWRFSMAGVTQDGPFSLFPGIDRIIAVIDGNGMDLTDAEGKVIPLEPFQPVSFSGDDPVQGRLRDGPIRDLNIMTRRGRCTARVDICDGPHDEMIAVQAGQVLLIHVLAGSLTLNLDAGEPIAAEETETLVHEGLGVFHLSFAGGSRAAVICVSTD